MDYMINANKYNKKEYKEKRNTELLEKRQIIKQKKEKLC